MKKVSLHVCLFLILFLSFRFNASAAKPVCDVPISWEFVDLSAGDPGAIRNDIPGKPYKDGELGVYNSNIHFCGGPPGGSRDATMYIRQSKRTVWFEFPNSLSNQSPPFGTSPFASAVGIRIPNITAYGVPGNPTTFYSRIDFGFTGPDGNLYNLWFWPDDSECPGDFPCVQDRLGEVPPDGLNIPVTTAWVKITYTAPDRWDVEGTLTSDDVFQPGSLYTKGTNKGQYSMPFKIMIKALASLPQ